MIWMSLCIFRRRAFERNSKTDNAAYRRCKGSRPQRLGRRLQVAPLLGRKTAALDIVARNTRFGDDKAHHQLHRRHLEREERHRTFVIDGHVAGHRQHEGGLTHRRACRHDDEVRQLPAERHAVDGHETRGTPLKADVFLDASSICISALASKSLDDCTERLT